MFISISELRDFIRVIYTEAKKRQKSDDQKRGTSKQGRLWYAKPSIPKSQKFYHASPRRFRHGDIITGGHEGGSGYAHPNVCMTTSPKAHGTIASNIPGWPGYHPRKPINDDEFGLCSEPAEPTPKDWYVYEVEPLYEPTYVEGNEEYQTKAAKVIQNLGPAKAFLSQDPKDNTTPVFSKKWPKAVSRAFPPDVEKDRKIKHAQRQARLLTKNKQEED